MTAEPPIELVSAPGEEILSGLVELLRDSVAGGASVNFVEVPDEQQAADYWRELLPRPDVLTWVCRAPSGRLSGTVSLVLADQPNGLHRAEVIKLLVARESRGQGIARRLLTTLEAAAIDQSRTLLILDTETGSPAEALYERWGWTRVGVIPGFALDVDGVPAGSTIFYKALGQ